MEANKNGNLVDVDRKAYETWKNMSEAERKPYVTQAGKLIHSEYLIIELVDDEADSATVGKFDQFYETSDDDDEPYHSGGFKSLNTTEW
ncbi:hypothetical protein PVK06_046221 [Gossypium arboreum]|uniref:ACB domain-containing protein n=1 Tax=Gossypium arboreum TaxID=29729 RepID=A0ABR0MBV2_GOSAR|nr:hypothetical protein PVK06_046221 [Gossypium arboreum]